MKMPKTPLVVATALAFVAAAAAAVVPESDAHEAAPAAAPAPAAHAVEAGHAFGMQYVPKFDERTGRGAWSGSRDRGMAFHRDLGVQVSREGLIWRRYEPEAGQHPNMADFDDVVTRLDRAGIAMQAMVTETPLWASTAPHPDPKKPETYKSAPPKGLNEPIFTDGTDVPGAGKTVNPANTWAAAIDDMVRRYGGRVRYWQMWNEPDYPKGEQKADFSDTRRSFFGSVDDYVRLLKVGYTVVKWHDPKAQVVTGGIGYADYLQAMLDRGAGRYFDQIDFHAYGWPGSDKALGEFLRVHDQMKQVLVKNGLAAKGLICSETGYTSLSPEIQADYIAKLYPTAIAKGVESTMYYANVNPSWKNMGLIDWRTMTQKTPGYWAYKHAAAALRDVRTVEKLALGGATGYRFGRANGTQLYVLWAPKPHAVSLRLPQGEWRVHDAVGHDKGSRHGGTTTLSLTDSPLYLDSDAKRAYAAPVPNPPLPYPGLAMAGAKADSVNEHHGGPKAAIDLDVNTNWVNGKYKAPEAWLSVALGHESRVARVKLKTGPMPEGTWFDVEVSSDGAHYRPVATHQTPTSWHMETVELKSPVKARYVRLHWHNPERRAASFSVFELEVH